MASEAVKEREVKLKELQAALGSSDVEKWAIIRDFLKERGKSKS